MQSGRSQQRAPGSFSPLPNSFSSSAAVAAAAASGRDRDREREQDRRPPSSGRPPSSSSQRNPIQPASSSSRPQIRRIDTSSSDDTTATSSTTYFNIPNKVRSPQTPVGVTSPSFPGFTAHPNGSASSLQSPQNFSRPNRDGLPPSVRNASPLTLPTGRIGHHSRKHSQTQGLFDSTLPSTSSSNLAQITTMSQGNIPPAPASAGLSASQIAAQAAMQHQGLQAHQTHSRNRSQTVPFQGSADNHEPTKRQVSRSNGPTAISGGPLSPPVLSLTEASVPRDPAFNSSHAAADARYHNGLLGNQAATTAANVVFPRSSPQTSPGLPSDEYRPTAFPPPLTMPEKPLKSEKSKVKLFSRPKKIDTKGEPGVKPLPSPSKIGSALASLQRANYSTTSLAETQSLYSLNNSSAATIRPLDAPPEKEGTGKEKEKEKKHHFLSRSKHKLSAKDDYHLPLSSAASNSRPVDPNAPSSLYNFNVPPSPGPNTSSFGKSVSGLDLRHGGRALREKRKEEKQQLGMAHDNESVFTLTNNNPTSTTSEWAGPSSLGTNISLTQSNLNFFDPVDSSKYGLNSMTLDDAWPYLKAKLLAIFEGEDLRLPIEDFNRVVTMHIQYAVQRRSAHIIIEDVRELLSTGFLSLDYTLRKTPEDRLIPALAEMWVFTFTSILPYMQAVFLPLDLEFSGSGPLMTADQARDFWSTVLPNTASESTYPSPASQNLDIRRLVLLAYRDTLILPRYDKLKMIFSRLSLEHLPSSLASLALASPPPPSDAILSTSLPRDIEFQPLQQQQQQQQQQQAQRPGTAMSLDPSLASYNSSSSTLLNNNNNDNNSNPSRSRAISNVSFGSGSEGTTSLLRPFTPAAISIGRDRNNSGSNASLRERDQNVEIGGKQVTDMVGRMLQCLSVLASVQTAALAPFEANSQSSSAAGAAAANAAAIAAAASASSGGDEGRNMVTELGRLLKLNWLGRGRTGRNRRGIVGGRVKREDSAFTGAGSSILSARSSHSGLSGLAIQHQQSSQQQPQVLREGVGAAG
ncbi:HbrB-like-domain-containing protein [Apiospora arundinis]|uniref:HbrB-like-domain-containing protein n=1 Tax=Apiospora arundinis TaxID=335852 RepID=A0ABR2IHQ4_9PEZI